MTNNIQNIEMLHFLEAFVYQTTYFLLFVQPLCFGFLFGKYTKLRDIFLCLCLIFAQLFLIDFGYSRLSVPTLSALNYICFALSLGSFGYMMRLLYIVTKARNVAKNNTKYSVEYYPKDFTKDFIGIVIIVALLFVVVVAKMAYDFV